MPCVRWANARAGVRRARYHAPLTHAPRGCCDCWLRLLEGDATLSVARHQHAAPRHLLCRSCPRAAAPYGGGAAIHGGGGAAVPVAQLLSTEAARVCKTEPGPGCAVCTHQCAPVCTQPQVLSGDTVCSAVHGGVQRVLPRLEGGSAAGGAGAGQIWAHASSVRVECSRFTLHASRFTLHALGLGAEGFGLRASGLGVWDVWFTGPSLVKALHRAPALTDRCQYRTHTRGLGASPIGLRACYAMPGTDAAYGATREGSQ
eukprot:99682-Rhodomonas_salina.2